MTVRHFAVSVLAATVVFVACGGNPEPETPAPVVPDQDSLQRYRDSVADAEAARRLAEEEARRAEAAREAAIADARAELEAPVFFDYDESSIRSDQEDLMRRKVEILRVSPQVQIRIEGHADERGSTEYNVALGSRRAVAIRDFFTGFGLPEARFAIVSFGEEQPAARGSGEQAWSQNRRAEFRITAGARNINVPGS